MTLVFADGFDHYNTGDIIRKWSWAEAWACTHEIHATAGRRSSQAYYAPYDTTSSCRTRVRSVAWASDDVYIVGVAFLGTSKFSYNAANGGTGIVIEYGGAEQIGWYINESGSISIRRGDFNDAVIGTTANVLSISSWYYIEFKVTLHDTTGSYELRVNGDTWKTGSGIDTKKQSAALANGIEIRGFPYNCSIRFDDIYVCNGLGTENNDFLGDVRVDSLMPDGAGTSTDWTPSAGANYECVDEIPPNDNTDYVSEATAGDHDTYAFDNLVTSAGAIKGIQTLAHAYKDDAGSRNIKLMTRPSSTDYESGTSFGLLDNYTYFAEIREQNPETSAAWTVGEVNASEFGVKLES